MRLHFPRALEVDESFESVFDVSFSIENCYKIDSTCDSETSGVQSVFRRDHSIDAFTPRLDLLEETIRGQMLVYDWSIGQIVFEILMHRSTTSCCFE
jgi:hypothetical protein